jgi:hypothetical protein
MKSAEGIEKERVVRRRAGKECVTICKEESCRRRESKRKRERGSQAGLWLVIHVEYYHIGTALVKRLIGSG